MMGAFQNPVLEGLIAGHQVRQARERAAMESFRVKAAVQDQIDQAFERKQDRLIREAVEKNRLMQTGAMPVSDSGTVALEADIGTPGQPMPLRGTLPVEGSGLPTVELGGTRFALPDQKMQRANELFARRDVNDEAVRLYAGKKRVEDEIRKANGFLVSDETTAKHPTLKGLEGKTLDLATVAGIFGKDSEHEYQTERDKATRAHQVAMAEDAQLFQQTEADKNRANRIQTAGMRGAGRASEGASLDEERVAAILEDPAIYGTLPASVRSRLLPALSKQGFKVPEKPPTDSQRTVADYATRLAQADPQIHGLEKKIVEMNPAWFAIQSSDKWPEVGQSGDFRQYMQSSRNFINAILRRESGAAISASEFENAYKQYLPRPGDNETTLQQKRANRALIIKSLAEHAGSAYKSPEQLLGTGGPRKKSLESIFKP